MCKEEEESTTAESRQRSDKRNLQTSDYKEQRQNNSDTNDLESTWKLLSCNGDPPTKYKPLGNSLFVVVVNADIT